MFVNSICLAFFEHKCEKLTEMIHMGVNNNDNTRVY